MSKKKESNYLVITGQVLILVLLVKWIWPRAIPFDFLQFWTLKGTFADVMASSWPAFVWAISATAVLSGVRRDWLSDPEGKLVGGAVISVWAGVVEEVCFRWIIFFGAIIAAKVSNFFVFGWLGFGVGEWVFNHIVGPIANWVTLGQLKPMLFGSYGWAAGAALVASNGKFRDGHSYQGPLGWVNSWFLGMFFFYLMFTYGLPAAMFVHFMYDFLIFLTLYVLATTSRLRRAY